MPIKERVATGRSSDLPQLARLARAFGALVALWFTRARTRRMLGELDDSRLRDIGLSRWEAEREASKPFWRA